MFYVELFSTDLIVSRNMNYAYLWTSLICRIIGTHASLLREIVLADLMKSLVLHFY